MKALGKVSRMPRADFILKLQSDFAQFPEFDKFLRAELLETMNQTQFYPSDRAATILNDRKQAVKPGDQDFRRAAYNLGIFNLDQFSQWGESFEQILVI